MYFGSEGSQGLRSSSSASLRWGSLWQVQLPHYKCVRCRGHHASGTRQTKIEASPRLLKSERGRRLFSIEFEQANGIPIIETGSQINSVLSRGDAGASLKPAPAAPRGRPNKVPLTHQLIFQCWAPRDKDPSLLGGFHPCTPPPTTHHSHPSPILPPQAGLILYALTRFYRL